MYNTGEYNAVSGVTYLYSRRLEPNTRQTWHSSELQCISTGFMLAH